MGKPTQLTPLCTLIDDNGKTCDNIAFNGSEPLDTIMLAL